MVFPNIVSLLEQHGIDCELVPLTDDDNPEHFLLLLRCSRADASVRAAVQRDPHVNPKGPIIVYDGVYTGHQHNAETIALLEAITEIFRDNGAWIPARDAS